MNLRRINYLLPILCLGLTLGVVIDELSGEKNTEVQTNTGSSMIDQNESGEVGVITWGINQDMDPVQIYDGADSLPISRTSLITTVPKLFNTYSIVNQGSQPYMLVNNQLIVLDSDAEGGTRTGVVITQSDPLIVYYRYQTALGSTSYLYQLTKNSSRTLDNLTLVGVVQDIYVFSLKEGNAWRGISAIINGVFNTLYTGTYTDAFYLGNTIKLDNNQPIYLSLTAGS